MVLNGLDLFSGIGGLSVALSEWVRPIAYCEIDTYCQGILLSRMHKQELQEAPIWDDIVSFDGYAFRDKVDIIFGGFPYQDISVAGRGKGLEGERSGLFFEIMRLAKEIQPKFLFLENVPAITRRGGWECVHAISALGYDCRWCVISAASVGALHKRERWFLLAHSQSSRLEGQWRESSGSQKKQSEPAMCCENYSDSKSKSLQQEYSSSMQEREREETWGRDTREYWPFESRVHWQEVVSEMGKCSDGLPYQSHRLRALGNAVVPIQAKEAFKILMGI